MTVDVVAELAAAGARHDRAALTRATLRTAGGTGTVWRCLGAHAGGRRRLGTAVPLPGGGALFRSWIGWLPSDELNLRPWDRDVLLGAGLTPTLLDDVDLFGDYLTHLERWSAGALPGGPRWLRKGRPAGAATGATVATVVLPGDPEGGVVGCWVRCGDHPDGARLLSTGEVLAAVHP